MSLTFDQLNLLANSGNGLNTEETRNFENHFNSCGREHDASPPAPSSASEVEVGYMNLVEFMYPFREDIRWDGDMTTVHKLRRVCKLARTTGTLADYISAAKLFCSAEYTPGGSIARETFQDLLRNCWLDLTDNDIMDVLRRLLPNEDGGYSYEDFLSLCEVHIGEGLNSTEGIAGDGHGDAVRGDSSEGSPVRKNLAASGIFDEEVTDSYSSTTGVMSGTFAADSAQENEEALKRQAELDAEALAKTIADKAWVEQQAVEREHKRREEDERKRVKLEQARLNEAKRMKEDADRRKRKEEEQERVEAEKIRLQEEKRVKAEQRLRETEAAAKEAEARRQKAAAVSIQKQVRAKQARSRAVRKRNARSQRRKEEIAAVEIQKHVRSRRARVETANRRNEQKENVAKQEAEKREAEKRETLDEAAEDSYSDDDRTGESELDYADDFESGTSVVASKDDDATSLGSIEDDYGDDFED